MQPIDNLAAWAMTAEELRSRKGLAVVRLLLAYPAYQAVVAFPPYERRRKIAALLRADYRALKAALPPGLAAEKLGSHQRPIGVRLRLPAWQLLALPALPMVGSIRLEELAGSQLPTPVAAPRYWSIKARFAIQVEGQVAGLQGFEERIVLVAAPDEEAARQQLRPTFARYAEPYLNSDGRLVRRQFEDFLDAYEVEAGPLGATLSNEVLEVFSEIKNRRLTPARAWLLT